VAARPAAPGLARTAGADDAVEHRFARTTIVFRYAPGYQNPGLRVRISAIFGHLGNVGAVSFLHDSASAAKPKGPTMPHRLRRATAAALAILLALQTVAAVLAQATPVGSPAATPISGATDWWKATTCYEIFVRSFADSDGDGNGDLRGLIGKLDYLNDGEPGSGDDLGVDCLWLMPIMQSPSYHGYDVTDYETIEADYGTNADFRALMDAAHARGIRVIVDFPINHTSVDHPWFRAAASDPASPYRDWYIFSDTDPGYLGPWGEEVWHENPYGPGYYYGIFDASMPDLNVANPDVTAALEEIAAFWLTEMGADGFRLDAVKHMIEEGEIQENTPETIAWLANFDDVIHQVKPDAYTVGEVNGAGTDGLQPYYPDTLDQYFQFQLAGAMVNAASFGGATQLRPIVAGTVERLPDDRWAPFLTNPDQNRIASQLGEDPDKLRVAAMLLLALPGTPFIYYGEEIGLPGEKPDEMIRTPMPWSAAPNGGFTTGTPWEPLQSGWQQRNVAAQRADPDSILATYRTWGQLREVHPALQTGAYLPVDSGRPAVLAFVRQHETETVLVVVNLGGKDTASVTVTLPDGIAGPTTDLIASGSGPDIAPDGAVTLPAMPPRTGTVYLIDTAG
jgi:glycosidase